MKKKINKELKNLIGSAFKNNTFEKDGEKYSHCLIIPFAYSEDGEENEKDKMKKILGEISKKYFYTPNRKFVYDFFILSDKDYSKIVKMAKITSFYYNL